MIRPLQNILKSLKHINRLFKYLDNKKINQDKRSLKNGGSEKKDNQNPDILEGQQVSGVRREQKNQAVRSPQTKTDLLGQQPALLGGTDQVMAEAAAENQPEEKMADVLLDVPTLKVEEIKLNVDNLDANVALRADLANFVKIDIGVHVDIAKVDLDIKGLDAKAILKVRLKQIYAIFSKALESMDKNPELFQNLLKSAEETHGTTKKNTGTGNARAFGELKSGVNNANGDNELQMGTVDVEGAQGVKAQTGKINEAIRDVSKGADRSVETGSDIKEEKRRKFYENR